MNTINRFATTLLVLVALGPCALRADNFTWSGGGTPVSGDYLWTDPDNWSGGIVPPSGADNGIYIGGTAGTSIDVNLGGAGFSGEALFYTAIDPVTPVPSSSFTLSGDDLTLTAVGGNHYAIDNASAALQTINNNLIITYDQISVIRSRRPTTTGSGVGVTLNGNITMTDPNATLSLRADNTSVITANGVISGSGGTTTKLLLTGDSSGYMHLNNGNNLISDTSIGGGRIYIGANNALGNGTTLDMTANGSFLYLEGYSQRISSLSNSGANNGRQNIVNTVASTSVLTYDSDGADDTFTGHFQGVASGEGRIQLVKEGSNTLILSPLAADPTAARNWYSDGTYVNAGTLLIYNPSAIGVASATGSGAVTVAVGATFGGDGHSTSAVIVNGTLRAGMGSDATGTLRLSGDLTLNDNSIIELALGDAGAHSILEREGGLWTFDDNQAFSLLDFGALAGDYDGIITGLDSAVDTSGWYLDSPDWLAVFTYNGSTNAIDLTLSAVPEPTSQSILAGLAAAGLVMAYQRKRRQAA